MPSTPIHPGEILSDELQEIGISAAALARTLDSPAQSHLSQIIAGKRSISAEHRFAPGPLLRNQP